MESAAFGHYRLEAVLDRGGLGDVYRAFDPEHERLVALKVLTLGSSRDVAYRSRFRREIYLASLLSEPLSVTVHRFGTLDGRLFVDMRLLPGRTVADAIAREGAMSPQQTVSIIDRVAQGLGAAHFRGVVHGDVKPSKIFLTDERNDRVLLSGLGVPRRMKASDWPAPPASARDASAFAYVAPELFREMPIGPLTDVYSLTCVLVACLTGRPPFPVDKGLAALRACHTDDDPPTPSALRPGLTRGFDDVVRRGMAKDPEHRYETPRDLATAARKALYSFDRAPAAPPENGQVGPFGIPHATPVGSQSMSARGGGGGSASYIATSASLDEVVALVSADRGPPETWTDVAATWRTRQVDRGWRTDGRIAAWVLGHGGGPGFEPGRVPAYARCVVEQATLSTPDPGPP